MGSGTQENNRYNLGLPQSEQNKLPPTIASAATIAPIHIMTFVTGTVQVATITPPMPGFHMLVLVFTNAAPGAFLTTGNIQVGYQPIQNRPILLFYDPATTKYWVMSVT
jgi:hypothetical protein